ncbi:hypothetical protein QFC21_001699 [Naganishia friedmannii]|uniref:Uncharacterized protein n=1 Tax=Naganishia friedmannii TaxID=89922 RepID=A0ACC2W2N8_9TREE|nr:hypothetical protein QFC21_001699 [Naganishia friedmannii]
MSSDTQSATSPAQSATSGVSLSTTQDSTGVATAPGTTVVSSSAQNSQATSSAPLSSATSASTTASPTAPTSSSSVSTSQATSSQATSTSQSFSSTRVVTVPPSTSTDPSSTSVIFTPSSSSTLASSTAESILVPVTTASSTSIALSTGAGGTIYSTTIFYTYVSSTKTRASSTSKVTSVAGSSGNKSGGGNHTGAIVGGVVGGVGGLALLALAGFFLFKKKKKARAAALDEKMYDPGYGRNNSNYLLGDLVNGTGVSPIEQSHISPFPRGPDPGYAGAATAAGLGAGAAGAYAAHDRGYGSSAGGDGYDNMTTTGGASSYDDHASYTHGMQPMNPYATYPSNAAYPSPALNRTDYAADLPNVRNPRWSGGWGVAAMSGVGNEGQQRPYSPHEYAATQPYGMGSPAHAQSPSDLYHPASASSASAGAAANRQEAEAGRAAYAPYTNAGPSVAPSSALGGRTSIGNSAEEYGQNLGGASGHARGTSDATDAMGRRESGMDADPLDVYPGPSVIVHTDGGEVPRTEELPPTYTSIRPEDRAQ